VLIIISFIYINQMTTFTKDNKLPWNQNIVDETYLAINGGTWLPTDEISWLKNLYKNLQESPEIFKNYLSLIAKTSGKDNYRLWFDVDETDDKTEKILDNINMILTKNLVNPDLKCFITKNETTEKKRHLKYKNIYVNNEIQKSLIKEINEKMAKKYVDEAARSGCRLDLINKWDKTKEEWINNTRYIKEDNTDMTEDEFINDYNIRKTGEIIEIQEHFKKNVEEFKKKIKNQKSSNITNINLDDLNKNVKLQIQQIEQNERFKNKLCDVNKIGEDYIVHLRQGSFLCPFVKRIHSSNRNYIIIKNDHKKTCLKCHHCEDKFEILNLSFNECLIIDSEEEIEEEKRKKEEKRIKKLYGFTNLMDKGYSDMFIMLQPNVYKCINVKSKEWYKLNRYNIYDKAEDCGIKSYIADNFYNILKPVINWVSLKHLAEFDVKTEQELKKQDKKDYKQYKKNIDKYINQIRKTVLTSAGINNIKKVVECDPRVYDKDFYDKLDMNSNLIAFSDCLYDLKKHEFRLIKPNDYISMNTGYKKQEKDKEKIAEIEDIIKKMMCYDEENYKTLMMVLATCLLGISPEKFVIFNGNGRNGKGVLNELMASMLGDYFRRSTADVLVNSIGSSKNCNVDISNMNKKRKILYQEPPKATSKRMNSSTIKELTGGDKINARPLFSQNDYTIMHGTHIMECNDKPLIDEADTQAIRQRLIDIPFKCTALPKKDYDKLLKKATDKEDFKKYHCIQDITYKTDEFKEKYRMSLFYLLIKFLKKYQKNDNQIILSKEIKKRVKDYCEMSEQLLTWFKENYEEAEEGFITRKDLWNNFRGSQVYKDQCVKYAEKVFIKKIEKKLKTEFKVHNYYIGEEKPENRRKKNSALVGWKIKEDEEEYKCLI